jgi:ABC-type transport system substrate-binding protein
MKKSLFKIAVFLLLTTVFVAEPFQQFVTGTTQDVKNIFVFGRKTYNRLDNFDPTSEAIGDYAEFYITNSFEPLYDFNQTYYIETGEARYDPWLATGYALSNNNMTVTVDLREDVKFSDGTDFNAPAVKWTFDRINYVSENVEDIHYSWFHGPIDVTRDFYTDTWNLSWVPDGTSYRYFNSCEVLDTYQIKINLNVPFAEGWLDAYHTGYFMSPTYYSTYWTGQTGIGSPTYSDGDWQGAVGMVIEDNSVLVSTGPFVLEYHRPEDFEGKMVKNEYYWNEENTGDVDEVIFALFESQNTLQSAFLAGEIDFIYDPIDIDATNASEIGDITDGIVTGYCYFTQFNAIYVNKTIREALVHAVDYESAIATIGSGRAVKGGGAIPPFNPYFNESIPRAYYNITHARKVLILAGIAQGLTLTSPEGDWLAVADSDNPIAVHTIKHSVTWDDYADLLVKAGRRVGIKLNDFKMEGGDIYAMVVNPDIRKTELEIFHTDHPAGNDLLGIDLTPGYWVYYASTETYAWNNFSVENPTLGAELDELVWQIDYVPEEELARVHSRIQEIVATNYLHISWFHPILYAGISKKWEGFPKVNNYYVGNFKLTGWNPGRSEVIPPIPGFPLEAIGIIGAISLLSLVFVVKRKTTMK